MQEPTNKKLYEEVKKRRCTQSTRNTVPIALGFWYRNTKREGGLTQEINLMGLWGAGLKRIGKTKRGNGV